LSKRLVLFDTNPNAPIPNTTSGRLVAWNPKTQKEVWGIDQVGIYNGGLLSTATGLLMQGDAEGNFIIRDADDGKVLKKIDLRSGIVGSPITYMVDGEQYISILVGWGGYLAKLHKHVPRIHPGTIYTFKLGGAAEHPEKMPAFEQPLTAMRDDAGPAQIGNGWNVFTRFCISCHPMPGAGHSSTPDLARSTDQIFEHYDEIVMDGALAKQGMPALRGLITDQELTDLKSFIFYSSKELGGGMSPNDYLTNIAQMQYLADQGAQIGCWLLVASCWLLVAGCRKTANNDNCYLPIIYKLRLPVYLCNRLNSLAADLGSLQDLGVSSQ